MNEPTQVPYWFWQGMGIVILYIIGQILVKWLDIKFFQKQDKWSGEERRHTVEIDEKLLEKFYVTYERHVKFVGDLATTSETSTRILATFMAEFKDHDDKESRNQKLIKEIHSETVPGE